MTISEYIQQQEASVQSRLILIYDTIRTTIPDAEERISWGMPTFWKGHNIIHFAAGKNHIGIYPGPEAIVEFSEKLTDYKTSKGAIQLPNNKELPLQLISEIAKWSYGRNAE